LGGNGFPETRASDSNSAHQQGNANPAPSGNDAFLAGAVKRNFHPCADGADAHPNAKYRRESGEYCDSQDEDAYRHGSLRLLR
jgi:hypothetical protein